MEVGYVGMIEVITEDNKLFKIFFMKYPDYVMKIMAIWMTLDELEGSRTRIDFIDKRVTNEANKFTYWHPFGIQFRYRYKLDDYNNWRHAPIYLERTRETKLCPNRKFAWYILVLEDNTSLTSGHFQNDGLVQPSLDFWRALTNRVP